MTDDQPYPLKPICSDKEPNKIEAKYGRNFLKTGKERFLNNFFQLYKIIRLIGKGTYSNVWLIQDVKTRKQYAIKMTRPEYIHVFLNEIQTLAFIRSMLQRINDTESVSIPIMKTNEKRERRYSFNYTSTSSWRKISTQPLIMGFIDSFSIDDPNKLLCPEHNEPCSTTWHCILMEYIEGPTLKEFIEASTAINKRIRKEIFRNIAYDLFNTLHHLHNLELVHRDIKSSNIILHQGPSGHTPYLIDYGFSHQLTDHDMLKFSTFGGTFHYESPEILSGLYLEDPMLIYASDVYAAGIALYNLSEGDTGPFETKTIEELKTFIQSNKFKLTHSSKAVNTIIQQCLISNPKDRPTAKQMLDLITNKIAKMGLSRV